jgi:hypothetical protein
MKYLSHEGFVVRPADKVLKQCGDHSPIETQWIRPNGCCVWCGKRLRQAQGEPYDSNYVDLAVK